jgi:toxin ParE1/3/4
MAREVVWSYEAASDLEALAQYIARDSTFYASAFVWEIRDASRSLNVFPQRGRIVPEIGNPHIRELFVREYRLIYSIEKSRVVVLGLIHGRRDLKRLWEKEKRA